MGGAFQPTLWSVVLRARNAADPHGRTALNRLCSTYWKPVYAYLRRKGMSPEDAKDATQGFFVHLLELDALQRVERGRGRFRSYLLAVLENFLANEWRKAHAARRGGGAAPLPLDFTRAETEVRMEPADRETPEAAFRRTWALTVLERSFEALARDFREKGRAEQFEAVRSQLSAAGDRSSYDALAARLGTSVTEVTNLLHRSRKRLRDLIRAELRDTVEAESDLDGEVRELFEAL